MEVGPFDDFKSCMRRREESFRCGKLTTRHRVAGRLIEDFQRRVVCLEQQRGRFQKP